MKRPNAAGSVLQALEPVANKLVEMEQARGDPGYARRDVQSGSLDPTVAAHGCGLTDKPASSAITSGRVRADWLRTRAYPLPAGGTP